MKMKQIALAAAVLAGAPAAFALTPAQIDGNTVRLWLSGASAPTAAAYKGVLSLCQGISYKDAKGTIHTNPGTVDAHIYQQCGTTATILPGGSCSSTGVGNTSNDRMAYSCTVNTDDLRAGSLETKKVVVYHTVEGGSFNAYAPHVKIGGEVNANLNGAAAYTLQRLSNLEGLGAGCAATASSEAVDISGQSNTVGIYRNCPTTTVSFTSGQAQRGAVTTNPDRPEGGLSDTEYLINKQNLDITTDLASIGSEVATNIGQAFGVAVSYPLYYQLQLNDVAAGNLTAATCTTSFTATLPNLTAACKPNLAASKYTAIANKNNIIYVDGTLFGAVATPPGTSGKIQFARRAITSGTQSASNIRFLNTPCATGLSQGALAPAAASTTKVNVTLQSSTGGVKTALTNATTAGEFGLGVVSAENTPGSSDKWAFVKLDGVSPDSDAFQRANAIDGSYTFWYELASFTAATAFTEGIDLITAVTASLGNPEITNLKGLFHTPAAYVTGVTVSTGGRYGNSCQSAY
jgi:hypothetical protein